MLRRDLSDTYIGGVATTQSATDELHAMKPHIEIGAHA